jgi:hypothetical protein
VSDLARRATPSAQAGPVTGPGRHGPGSLRVVLGFGPPGKPDPFGHLYLTLTKIEIYIYNRVVGPKPITQRHPTAIQRHGNSNTTTVKTLATTNVD